MKNWFRISLFLIILILGLGWAAPASAVVNTPERVVEFYGSYDSIYMYCYNGVTYEGCPDPRISWIDDLRWLRIEHPLPDGTYLPVSFCTYSISLQFVCTTQWLSPGVQYLEYGSRPRLLWDTYWNTVTVGSPWGGGYERVMLPYNHFMPIQFYTTGNPY